MLLSCIGTMPSASRNGCRALVALRPARALEYGSSSVRRGRPLRFAKTRGRDFPKPQLFMHEWNGPVKLRSSIGARGRGQIVHRGQWVLGGACVTQASGPQGVTGASPTA